MENGIISGTLAKGKDVYVGGIDVSKSGILDLTAVSAGTIKVGAAAVTGVNAKPATPSDILLGGDATIMLADTAATTTIADLSNATGARAGEGKSMLRVTGTNNVIDDGGTTANTILDLKQLAGMEVANYYRFG